MSVLWQQAASSMVVFLIPAAREDHGDLATSGIGDVGRLDWRVNRTRSVRDFFDLVCRLFAPVSLASAQTDYYRAAVQLI